MKAAADRAGVRAGGARAQPPARGRARCSSASASPTRRSGPSTSSPSRSTAPTPTRRSSRSATACSPTASPSTSRTTSSAEWGRSPRSSSCSTTATTMAIPPQVIVQEDVDEREALAEAADRASRGRRSRCRPAERGDKRRILELAERNARLALDQERLKAERRRQQRVEALDELQEALGLDALPLRIECFDISNLMGTHTVASMVVFEGGAPKKSDYRRFNVRGIEEGVPDDFAAMEEVLGRRLAQWETQQDLSPHDPKRNESFATLPNLIVIDGGPGPARGRRARARGLPRPRRHRHLAGQAHRGGLRARPAPADRARPRHAGAAAAAARPRRGAPLRDHPSPHAPRHAP